MSVRIHSSLSALVARDLARSYGDRVVLDGVDLVANPGERVGLVGENGVGKSTLLRLAAGREQPDAGRVERPRDLVLLDQELSFVHGATIGSVLEDALSPLHEAVAALEVLATRLAETGAREEYAATLEWAEHHEAWDAERRVRAAADRLGLGELDRARPLASMSGGQRMRLALAAVVGRRPECVLLDEPTNHLDDRAVEFLEEFLVGLPGAVVVASHDRTFLDNVCTTIVDLEPGYLGLDGSGGGRYTGGYSDHLVAKREARKRWEEAYLAHQEELDELRATAATTARSVAPHNRPPRDNDRFIHHFKGQKVAKAVGRRVRDTDRRIAELQRARVPKPPRPLSFAGGSSGGLTARHGGSVWARDLLVPGRLEVPRLDVSPGERLLVTGANGSGKSTLLKVVAGELGHAGDLQVSARRVGLLAQESVFSRPDRPAVDTFGAATGAPVPLRELGLLHPRELARPVGALSAGQQRRLALAILVARRPDLLLLDEPTNHISLALADEIEEALGRSTGTVLVASHDRWLRRRWDGPELGL